MPDYPRPTPPQRFLPLSVPVFHILLSLSDQDLHGYAIIQDVRARTAGEVDLTASTLYAAIKRLLGSRLIDELAPAPTARVTIHAAATIGLRRSASPWRASRRRASSAC